MRADLVMLHGANGCGDLMSPLAQLLRAQVGVKTPNLAGHGGRPVPERFSVQAWAEDIVDFLDQSDIARAFFFGYSFGGYVALYLARRYPQRVRGVCTLATKYVFDENAVRHFVHLADPARLRRPGNPRPQELARTHHPQDWVAIVERLRAFFRQLGEEPPLSDADLGAITVPALVISSDSDQLVPLAETYALARLLRCGAGIYRGVAHPFSVVPHAAIAPVMRDWMAGVS